MLHAIRILILCCLCCQTTYGNDTLRVYFATGKSSTGNSTIEQLKTFLQQYQKADTLSVTGYADEPGSIADNNTLSRNRAIAIRQLLLQQGIPPGNILTAGKGIVTKTGNRQEDRRADIVIRRSCDREPAGNELDLFFSFKNTQADNCDLKQIVKMAELLDLNSGMQLHLTFYTLCPICRTDSTIAPAYYPLLEEENLKDKRWETLQHYLQEHNADVSKVYYNEIRVCFKNHRDALKDSSSMMPLLDQQRRLFIKLYGL